MSKRSKAIKKAEAKLTVLPDSVPPKKSGQVSLMGKRVWKLVVALSVVTTIVLGFFYFKDRYATRKEKYDKENFDEGNLKVAPLSGKYYSFSEKPPSFLNTTKVDSFPLFKGLIVDITPQTSDGLLLGVGQNLVMYTYDQLHEGMKLVMSSYGTCENSVVYLLLKDDRLYVSAEFKDLQTEQHIGTIEYNHWRVYIPNLLSWKYDDHRLEVRDKQNNIVCSIITNRTFVEIAGYYINPTSVSILGNNTIGKKLDTCILKSDPDWKQRALVPIGTITSIFKFTP